MTPVVCSVLIYIQAIPSLKTSHLVYTNAHLSPNMRPSELAFALLCASALTSAAPLAEVIKSHAVARSVTGPAFDQGQPIDGEGKGAPFSGWR